MPQIDELFSAGERKDLDHLMEAILAFAKKLLRKYGGFLPFGASMDSDGKINLAAAHTGEEKPDHNSVTSMLIEGFRKAEKPLRAVAMANDSRVVPPGGTEKIDAIQVHLEHSSRVAFVVFVPYRKGLLGGYRLGKTFASMEDLKVFD